ncbi:MAG TPA: acetoacetate--CoA ligase [Ignavibacteriaceae bacterium]|nr:acetoacetate--CoA ligase [Ignavibacteriaceae bacterium]
MKEPLWTPSAERVSSSNMTAFMRYAELISEKPFCTYNDLYEWSVTDLEEFWKSIWVLSGIIHSKKYEKILTNPVMPGAKWFEGSRLNFAENLLKYRDNHTALISAREDNTEVRLTYSDLYAKTASLAHSLKQIGLKEGDRAAGFVTNIPEAVIAMLAVTSIGAVWSSASPDFGFHGILERFGQIQPKVLFAVEEYRYNGKLISCTEKIKQITGYIPEIEKVILIPSYYDFQNPVQKKPAEIKNSVYIDEMFSNQKDEIEFRQLPFDHPVYIMYSSGTTGKPKCIVHGAGGTLLQHFKELSLHTNLTRKDIITYYTTCGWMMWNWLVSSLNIGATIFLYDGSPAYPSPDILWKKIDEEKISIFGTSPKYLNLFSQNDIKIKNEFDLSSLKTILSTGAPLPEKIFRWVYSSVKNDLQLSSISGGTDIISCFMLGNPNLPVYAGELQCRGLGMKVESYDENGKPVINKKGELVCTKPFPSMPVFFWNDPDGEKYRSAYFDYYPGIWRHGDYIEITEKETIIIYGRSDATLNPGGIRIGTAEIYNVIEAIEEISDSLVVGQKWKDDIRVILFVVLKEGMRLDQELIQKIKNTLRTNSSPRHVPAKIIQVNDIPRTINFKKVELAVKKIIEGEEADNKEALANPGSLEQFKNINALLAD